jgi:hypothetical protein
LIGIIHKVLHDLLIEIGGQELVNRINRRGKIDLGSFRIVDSQKDHEFALLVPIVIEETGLKRSEVMDAFSVAFINYAESLFPEFFRMSSDARDFLIRQPKIHASLAAGLDSDHERASVRQKFQVTGLDDGALDITYESESRLCDLYQSLAHQLAERYGDRLDISVMRCGHGSNCSLRLFFNAPEKAAQCVPCEWACKE